MGINVSIPVIIFKVCEVIRLSMSDIFLSTHTRRQRARWPHLQHKEVHAHTELRTHVFYQPITSA